MKVTFNFLNYRYKLYYLNFDYSNENIMKRLGGQTKLHLYQIHGNLRMKGLLKGHPR